MIQGQDALKFPPIQLLAISRQKLWLLTIRFVVALLVYGAFLYIYKNSISPGNLYIGLSFKALTLWEYSISIGFYLLPLFWIPVTPQRPSDIAIWLLYIFSYAPTTFLCFHVMDNPFPDAFFLLFFLLTALIMTDLSRRHHIKFNLVTSRSLKIPLDKIIIVLSALLGVYILSLSGFGLNLDIVDIYTRRLAAREYSSWVYGYMLSFSRSVVTIFSIYLFFVKRIKISLLILVICSIGSFSFDGTKTSLLVPIYLALMYYFVIHKKSYNTFLVFLLFLTIASIIEFKMSNFLILSEVFVRRVFMIPGHINIAFWEYYSIHDKVMMADSIGSFFADAANITPATFVIGEEYFRSSLTNANTGIWMGAYAHFGIIGIYFTSILAGFILGLIDNLTRERFFILGFLVCSYVGIIWAEQMFHTSMLTGGIFYLWIFLMLYRSSTLSREKLLLSQYKRRRLKNICINREGVVA